MQRCLNPGFSERIGNSRRTACQEALAAGVASADVILNILARQREPDPPANVLTPGALALHAAPVANCARYDTLREGPHATT